MRTLPKILSGLFIVLIFDACSNKVKHEPHVKIQGDTLKIITETSGDTVFKQYIRLDNKTEENHNDTSIYSTKSIDTTIVKSNFYFTAKEFKIYFDKVKVVAYCDSVIKVTPPDKPDEGLVNWSIITGMKELKKAAQSDKEMEVVQVDWLSILLERFNPLIVNDTTHQISKCLLKEKFLSKTFGYRNYSSINQRGDTSFIWFEQDFLEYKFQEADKKNGM
jgi:hypothetical protein